MLVGLDIGTTKTTAIVGEITETGIDIIGIGTSPAKELRKLALVMNDREKRGINNSSLTVDLADAAKITISQKNVLGRTQSNKNGKQYRI